MTIFSSILLPSANAMAEQQRIAFVVGIDRYENLPKHKQLDRAAGDSRTVNAYLSQLGYRMFGGTDLTRSKFNAEFSSFTSAIKTGDKVVIFISGHGFSIDGQNFIAPRDIPFIRYGRENQQKREAISVSELLEDIRKKKPESTVLILDACREHPFIPPEFKNQIANDSGLDRMEPAVGEFIIFSASAGGISYDRLPGGDSSPHSVFSRFLIPLLSRQNLRIRKIALDVRREVFNLSKGFKYYQLPAYYDGMIGDFCFGGCAPGDSEGQSDNSLITIRFFDRLIAEAQSGQLVSRIEHLETLIKLSDISSYRKLVFDRSRILESMFISYDGDFDVGGLEWRFPQVLAKVIGKIGQDLSVPFFVKFLITENRWLKRSAAIEGINASGPLSSASAKALLNAFEAARKSHDEDSLVDPCDVVSALTNKESDDILASGKEAKAIAFELLSKSIDLCPQTAAYALDGEWFEYSSATTAIPALRQRLKKEEELLAKSRAENTSRSPAVAEALAGAIRAIECRKPGRDKKLGPCRR